MIDPKDCDHDFRRLFPENIRGCPVAEGSAVLAIVCCRCGISPMRLLRVDDLVEAPEVAVFNPGLRRFEPKMKVRGHEVNGDWPWSHRITAFYNDMTEGPSVEFEVTGEA